MGKKKDIEEMINNTIAIKQATGVDLFPYRCERVSKRTMPHIIMDGPDKGKTLFPDGSIK
jgi:hypothetical protein